MTEKQSESQNKEAGSQKPAGQATPQQQRRPRPAQQRPQQQRQPQQKPAQPASKQGQDKAQADVMPHVGGIENVYMRNEYYRDGYRSLQKIALFEGLGIVILLVVLGFFITTTKTSIKTPTI